MKIRDRNLVIIGLEMAYGESSSCYTTISYDTFKNILNKKVEFWEDNFGNFYATSLTAIISPKLKYLKDIENLIKLEESNKETEFIVAKKRLIDKLEGRKDDLDPYDYWHKRIYEYIDAIIDELKAD